MLRVKNFKKVMVAFMLALAIMITMPAAVLANGNAEAATPNVSVSGGVPSHGGVPGMSIYFSNYDEFPKGIYVIPKVEVYSSSGALLHEEELAPVRITSWGTAITFNENVTPYLTYGTYFEFSILDSYFNVIADSWEGWWPPPPYDYDNLAVNQISSNTIEVYYTNTFDDVSQRTITVVDLNNGAKRNALLSVPGNSTECVLFSDVNFLIPGNTYLISAMESNNPNSGYTTESVIYTLR